MTGGPAVDIPFATKEALFSALKAEFKGTRVSVTWADPGADQTRRSVWFTETVEPELEPVAMVAGRRKPTNLTAELTIRMVAAEAGDPIHAERAALALKSAVVELVLAFQPTSVAGLVDLRPIRSLTTIGEHAILGTASQCDVTIRVRARLQS
ncbi:hypothetical protein [Actinosynnema sp. NPDC020468]|uniref:hypothetical protein n=1 Tax=Actinosynnema sp. NPDC020468 TaxID=3154488 RepID=UPI0033D1AC04